MPNKNYPKKEKKKKTNNALESNIDFTVAICVKVIAIDFPFQ